MAFSKDDELARVRTAAGPARQHRQTKRPPGWYVLTVSFVWLSRKIKLISVAILFMPLPLIGSHLSMLFTSLNVNVKHKHWHFYLII